VSAVTAPTGVAGAERTRSSRLRGVAAGAFGVAAVVLTAAVFTQFGTIAPGLAPALVLLILALPIFVAGGALLVRLRILPRPDGSYPLTLLSPMAAYYAAFFVVPLGFLALFSVSTSRGFGDVAYGFSLENFSAGLDATYIHVFLRTLRFALLGTGLVIVAGWPLAYWLARYAPARRKNALVALVIVPFWTSFLIRTYSFLIVLDPSFPLSDGLRHLGLTDGPLSVLYTGTAVQIGIVYNYLPLFVLPAYAALERLDWTLLDAADDLGASAWAALRQITVPLALPGLLTGALLVFIPMMGEYVIPQILGGGKVDFIGNIVQRAFLEQQNYPLGAAIAMLLMAALGVFLVAYLWLTTRATQTADA
jgi:spermidine/putrescine transport system permease protein